MGNGPFSRVLCLSIPTLPLRNHGISFPLGKRVIDRTGRTPRRHGVLHQQLRGGRRNFHSTNSLGTFIELGTLDGRNSSAASGINNSGDVVGSCYSCEGGFCSNWTAFLYRNGVMVDLNDRLSQSDWRLVSATAINDKGQILAIGRKDGQPLSKALLLTPAEILPVP